MSLVETIRGGEHAYFDSAVTLLFFLLIGRYLDQRARGRARSAAERLLALTRRRVDAGAAGRHAPAASGRNRSRPGRTILVASRRARRRRRRASTAAPASSTPA